jgi:ubiquinone/menaquinone biosynthesis C-methylase UbiE
MENFDKKKHWETIYKTKELKDVSWYQPVPQVSLDFIEMANLSKEAALIDVGGGDSFLVDHLLELGYSNLTVLDISESAIERAKERLGVKSNQVKWIVSDVLDLKDENVYDLWHDRAAFHFLTKDEDVKKYVEIVAKSLSKNGQLVVGTFSEQGPTKCSGVEITQYSVDKLDQRFGNLFRRIASKVIDHQTPFNTVQNFVFCSYQKK